MSREVFYFMVLLIHTILTLVDPYGGKPLSGDQDSSAIEKLPDDQKEIIKLVHNYPAKQAALKAYFRLAFDTGFDIGYKTRSAQHFLEMFSCAVQHGKVTLEVYKDFHKIYSKCEGNQEAMDEINLRTDIDELITKNDQWIEVYENKKISNGYFTTRTNPTPDEKPPTVRHKTSWEITKMLRHWYCIVNYTVPSTKSKEKTLNTNLSSKTPLFMPPFISKLRNQLLEIQHLNPVKYKTTHEIFLRFSALSGRTYKMF